MSCIAALGLQLLLAPVSSTGFVMSKLGPNGKPSCIRLEVLFLFVITIVLPFVSSQRPLLVVVLALAMEASILPVDVHLLLTHCDVSVKRRRNLIYNVRQNQPNAKSHGDGHLKGGAVLYTKPSKTITCISITVTLCKE